MLNQTLKNTKFFPLRLEKLLYPSPISSVFKLCLHISRDEEKIFPGRKIIQLIKLQIPWIL